MKADEILPAWVDDISHLLRRIGKQAAERVSPDDPLVSVIIPALSVAASEESHTSAMSHSEGAPCPDGDEDGPCDDNCPCLCCPGHIFALGTFAANVVKAYTNTTKHEFFSFDAPLPSGVSRGIFRPPRA